MKYMVINTTSVNSPNGITSTMFPRIVEAADDAEAHDIVRNSFDPPYNPRPGKSFYIIPMTEAVVISYREVKPPVEYVVSRVT